MSLTESEYTVLRHTIASRGTARMTLLPVTLIGWALVAGTAHGSRKPSSDGALSLAVLAGGFEAIHALHVGVERIGRYLQVFYESTPDGPMWETTAMSVGPALPGGGVDPLFTVVFAFATAAEPAFRRFVSVVDHAGAGRDRPACTRALLARLVRARGAATRQRAVDLESYRAVKVRMSNGKE